MYSINRKFTVMIVVYIALHIVSSVFTTPQKVGAQTSQPTIVYLPIIENNGNTSTEENKEVVVRAQSMLEPPPASRDYRPISGTTEFGCCKESEGRSYRYIKHTFKWSPERLEEFQGRENVTFELDLRLDNFRENDEYGSGVWAYGFVKVYAPETNLPNYYEDTRLLDNDKELSFSVGVPDATILEANEEPYEVTLLVDGGTNGPDRARLEAALGWRFTEACTSPVTVIGSVIWPGSIIPDEFCVDDVDHWDIAPAWDIGIPEQSQLPKIYEWNTIDKGSVTGHVLGVDLLSRATVYVLHKDTMFGSTKTDAEGKFKICKLPSGRFDLVVIGDEVPDGIYDHAKTLEIEIRPNAVLLTDDISLELVPVGTFAHTEIISDNCDSESQESTPIPAATATPSSVAEPGSLGIVNITVPNDISISQSFIPEVTVQLAGIDLLESRGDMLRHVSGENYSGFPHVAVVGNHGNGSQYTFRFYDDHPFVAPDSAGTYQSIWRVWADGQFIGPEIVISFTVAQATPSPTPSCQTSENGVTLFEHEGQGTTGGLCSTFSQGDYPSLGNLNNKVSSIRNPDDKFSVHLFAEENFSGQKVVFDTSIDNLGEYGFGDKARSVRIERHIPPNCSPGSDGVVLYNDREFNPGGGCITVTSDVPDLGMYTFDGIVDGIDFVGSFVNTKQISLYNQANYQDLCGTYHLDQSDLRDCTGKAVSVKILDYTPPTPIPTIDPYHGNIAPLAVRDHTGSDAIVDGSLTTEWVPGHKVPIGLIWNASVTIRRIVVWDRPSNNGQGHINKLAIHFSDGTYIPDVDMISAGPACADVTFPAKSVTWVNIVPFDASGTNGYREVEVWATTGAQQSTLSCVNPRSLTPVSGSVIPPIMPTPTLTVTPMPTNTPLPTSTATSIPAPTATPVRAWRSASAIPGTTGNAYNVRVVIDSTGVVHAVWREQDSIGHNTYYAYRTAGVWSTPLNLSNAPSASSPGNLIVDRNDTLHLVWVYDGVSPVQDVYYTSKPQGGSWSTPVKVTNNTDAYSYESSLAVDSTGGLHLVYWKTSPWQVFYQTKPSNGSWTNPVTLSAVNGQRGTRIAIDGNDQLHVVWTEDHLVYYRSKSLTGTWSSPVSIADCSVNCGSPKLVAGANNTIHLLADDYSVGDVYYTSKPSGGSWSADQLIASNDVDGWAYSSDIAVSSNGTLSVVFRNNMPNDEIYVITNSGQGWSTPLTISNISGISRLPAITERNGTIIAVWSEKVGNVHYPYVVGYE